MKVAPDHILKIQWANKRIEEFHAALNAFKNTNPYGVTGQRDPKTGNVVYCVVEAKEIPVDIALIAGDVLQNLRTALDYLALQLVDVNSGKPGSHTGFPIFDDAAKYQAGFAAKVKGMRQEAIDAIHATKPYKGGDNAIWRLHRLNNIDKHRLLFTVGAACRAFYTSQHFRVSNPAMAGFRDAKVNDVWVPLKWSFPLKKGDILLVDSPDHEVNKDIQFITDVALNEPGISEGEPLVLVLRSSWQRVWRIAQKCEMLLA